MTAQDAARALDALPEAVLWDMDGTLVDTEPCWMAAERALVAEFDLPWTEQDALSLVGLSLLASAARIQAHGVRLEPEVIVERLLDDVVAAVATDLVWQPGALELLTALRAAGVPCALVTMSYTRFADAVLSQAPSGAFDLVVTGDTVTQGKPHPEAYLTAAQGLGVEITRCVAIEDSPPGITSALASGARTLGVAHVVPVEPRPGLSRAASLSGLDLDVLRRLVAGEVLDLTQP